MAVGKYHSRYQATNNVENIPIGSEQLMRTVRVQRCQRARRVWHSTHRRVMRLAEGCQAIPCHPSYTKPLWSWHLGDFRPDFNRVCSAKTLNSDSVYSRRPCYKVYWNTYVPTSSRTPRLQMGLFPGNDFVATLIFLGLALLGLESFWKSTSKSGSEDPRTPIIYDLCYLGAGIAFSTHTR